MYKRLVSTLTALAFAVTIVGITALPAQAQAEPDDLENFMPDSDESDKDQLTDAFDGTDQLAHLTAVTSDDATQVEWFWCTNPFAPGQAGGTAGSCEAIGTDTTGEAVPDEDIAFEVFWNIPADLDGDTVSIVSQACNGATGSDDDLDNIPDNCIQLDEDDVILDDGSPSGGGQEDHAGGIIGICTTEVSTGCDAASEFTLPVHGRTVPNTGFSALVSVSAEIDDGDDEAEMCIDVGIDATVGPVDCDDDNDDGFNDDDDAGVAVDAGTQRWIFDFLPPVNAEFDLGLFGDDVGDAEGADCDAGEWSDTQDLDETDDICVLDEVYLVSGAVKAAAAPLSFDIDGDDDTDDCEDPDQDETNPIEVGATEFLEGCLFSATDVLTGEATMELTGVGDLDCNDAGTTAHDHDNNGETDHCHWDDGEALSGGNVLYEADVDNPEDDLGDSTIKFCPDPEQDLETSAGHGCGDETVSSTAVKHWVRDVNHVHLVYSGTGDTADPCHTGDTFKRNKEGDTDTLLVCTFDANDEPASTTPPGNGALTWANNNPNSVAFTANPPTETALDTGQATLGIEAINQGSSTITVTETNLGTTSSVTKTVQEGPGGFEAECNNDLDDDGDGKIDFPADPGCVSLNDNSEEDVAVNKSASSSVSIKHKAGAFRGRVQSRPNKCVSGRRVTVKKKQPGPDATVGSDRTNSAGKYSVGAANPSGKYYAKAASKRFTNNTGGTTTCRGARSRTIRR